MMVCRLSLAGRQRDAAAADNCLARGQYYVAADRADVKQGLVDMNGTIMISYIIAGQQHSRFGGNCQSKCFPFPEKSHVKGL